MTTERAGKGVPLPLALKVVASITILSGLWPAFDMAFHLSNGILTLNPTVLQIPAGIGLLLRKRSCRILVLAFHWLGLVSLLVAAAGATLPVVGAVLSLGYLVWEYRVLTKPAVKQAFGV